MLAAERVVLARQDGRRNPSYRNGVCGSALRRCGRFLNRGRVIRRAFVGRCGRLVLGQVERGDDLLLALRGGREFFAVLERLAELLGEVLALPMVLLHVALTFAQALVEAAECVFDG